MYNIYIESNDRQEEIKLHNPTVPKTIKKWLDKNTHIVHEFHMEEDEWGEEHEGPWSIWVYFKLGWRNELHYEHQIHEPTVKDFMDATLFIKPCDCDDCTFSQES